MLSEALTRGLLFALLGLQKTSFLVELAELGHHENWKLPHVDLYTVLYSNLLPHLPQHSDLPHLT